ncbi:uncharacterized protein SCHCODRAFT_02606647 [Schizophyllum commune H4-8]|uniref:SnoaL-like domain-containing protein n=1 Tax=Schizophyllum commune (strain H4-8 / FGSC 9210) TaxID=578458 RepID=D8PWE9_SCHCM|nr:uncharacterized protein SCHCODRAFT_02606647 [Schizophyllum commune H4-8]KAI5899978.1 hypothetical protein SCHCODRAFT_02606647 [Schizophyllum commune H4-8]
MSTSHSRRRSHSHAHSLSPEARRPRSPSPGKPCSTFHPSLLPVPTPSLVSSAASGARYTGGKVHSSHRRSISHDHSEVHTELHADHERVLHDLKELYSGRPSPEIFERSWHPLAIFEDPYSKCKGITEIAAQWYAMTKFLSNAEIISARVMSSTRHPNRLVFAQTVAYTYRYVGTTKTVSSIVIVDLDDKDRVIRLVDQWDGEAPPTHYGAELLRRGFGKLGPWLFRVPKLQVQH